MQSTNTSSARQWRRVTARALAGLLVSAGVIAVGPGAVAASTASGTVVQPADLLPGLSRVPTAGQVDLSQVVQVTVALSHPDAAGESKLLAAMYTKGSPSYHHFLTPAGYAAKFAVPASTYARVVSGLTTNGMRAVYQAPTRSLLVVQGTLQAAARTFHVSFGEFSKPDGTHFFANTNAPTVPVGVERVLGLNSLAAFLPPTTNQTLCAPAGGTCVGAVTPQELWSVYNQPSSDLGQGQEIGVIGAGDYVQPEKDLRQYETEFNLPKVDVIAHNVADSLAYTGGEGEWAMDSEASTGMAPDVQNLQYYFSDALGGADAYATWVNDPNGPAQANNSFGGCEALDIELGEGTVDDPLFQQADLEGRTLFVSSGDTGGSCTVLTGNGFLNTGVPQVEYPCSSAYVTCVGGTVLYTDGGTPATRVSETGWSHTGGGTSLAEPQPSWQANVNKTTNGTPGTTMVGQCAYDPTGAPVTDVVPCRGVPDVAALSGDITVLTGAVGRSTAGNGYQDVEGGSDLADGGTSLSSPLWVGMWTRMQAASSAAGGLGFAAPALYHLAYDATADAADFYNVAVGDNGQWHDNPTSPLDPTGWSYVSGLGVPNVDPMIHTLDGTDTPVQANAAFGGGTFTVLGKEPTAPPACTSTGGAPTTYYLQGTSSDQANKDTFTTTATFGQAAPTDTSPIGDTQTANWPNDGSQFAESAFDDYWVGSYSGDLCGSIKFDWWWSSANADAEFLGANAVVTVWADPTSGGSSGIIGQAPVTLNAGATPSESTATVQLSGCPCTVAQNLVIEVSTTDIDPSGVEITAHYGSTAVPSAFTIVPGGPTPTLPEAPMIPLLVIGGTATAVGVVWMRRRAVTRC